MKFVESLEKSAKEATMRKIYDLIDKDPEKNVDRIFYLAKKLVTDEDSKKGVEDVERYYHEMPSVKEFIQGVLKNTNPNCLKMFYQNFIGNAVWNGIPKRAKWMEKEDTKIPFVLLISPSMRCNLRCKGCYAATYPKDQGLKYEEVDKIVGQARDLGIHFIIVLGGEPFFVDYMWRIYEKYNDIEFVPFTNGSLFTEEVADKLVKLGNIMPMFSLEGFEKETDARRGKGTFKKVMEGMELLKSRGIPFGVSSATSTHNIDTVTSDDFIDMLIEKGSKMSWYFIYMPVGDKPDVKDMLTPKQRIELGRRTRKIRTTKPYFTIDFFNDAPYVGGCIAGKFYCHINSNGDVEPCIFAHIAKDNAKDKDLIDIFRGPLFKELRSRQPYNKNMLLPCMMIDNPDVIREISEKVNAYPTDESGKAMLKDDDFHEKLEKLAKDFTPYAEEAWKEDFNSKGNDKFSRG
ncbi:radical SAM protein [Clostridium fallax]|uniref:Radical SAM superfamily enzyme, MoaA/NifB/PqqE/SkfB family n=1 Tax=Clostridium fallax TaxID=1533 RepID=A0A1M4WH39_9CLOT|nr:radical SAM protein [Clostridium fallax]SHE80515.1 Radical SAM superfamily enzyme, MoaA/NifB/PqqE/SkfB family [Clostridium fallax]SQB05706.1 radical SAM domain-containing protein [Clostridium fallax]